MLCDWHFDKKRHSRVVVQESFGSEKDIYQSNVTCAATSLMTAFSYLCVSFHIIFFKLLNKNVVQMWLTLNCSLFSKCVQFCQQNICGLAV